MAHDVFISYAVEDRAVADKVCAALEGQGIKCWIAPRDVPYGADYEEAIVDAISASPLLILVLSAHSNASPHVKREIQNACIEGSQTQIIPLRIADIAYSKALRYYLGSAQWLDASTPPLEQHLRRLVEHVRARLPARADAPVSTSTTSLPRVYADHAGAAAPPQGERPAQTGARRKVPAVWIASGAVALVIAGLLVVLAVRSFLPSGPRNDNAGDIAVASTPPTPVTPQNDNAAKPTATPTPTPQPTPTPNKPTPTPTPVPTPTPRSAGPFSDDELAEKIERRFNSHDGLKSVEVRVKDGVVVLDGEVYSESCLKMASDLADYYARVKGVVRVENHVKISNMFGPLSCVPPPL